MLSKNNELLGTSYEPKKIDGETELRYKSEIYYKFSHFAKNWVATSGVMNYCAENKCNWVLDLVASYVPTLNRASTAPEGIDYLLTINVELQDARGARFSITQETGGWVDENTNEIRIIVNQDIEYTDLKGNLKFWAINSSSGNFDPNLQTVLLLPEEY